ncbi:hypothetical protein Bca4012_029225 [Brassica carinata]
MISPGLCRSPRRLLDEIYDDLSSSLSLSFLDESAMNLLYEIKKKDGRTKRRRLVKRDNYNEASVIQVKLQQNLIERLIKRLGLYCNLVEIV